MLFELFKYDRRLRIEYKKLTTSGYVNNGLLKIINNYFTEYAKFNNLSPDNIIEKYYRFSTRYSKDIDAFIATGKYPNQLGASAETNRIDYDVALILSTLTTIQRHRIMDNFARFCKQIKGETLMIGIGSGAELELINEFSGEDIVIDAYDFSIQEFVKKRFSQFNLIEGEYKNPTPKYNYICAIELLEHLKNPYDFLALCSSSLEKGGLCAVTTATNIPQFDHLYNFSDPVEFEKKITEMKLQSLKEEIIDHYYFNKPIGAKNTWYILQKTI